jgi:intracellular sulfur oxidation DsrE/DsrF family protein
MAVLSVVEQAYRGTIEEQDDTILWMSHMLKNAGADLNVLLRGNAVNYAAKGQDASGLTIGGVPLAVPPTIDEDIEALVAAGVQVYAVEEDIAALGITDNDLVAGVRTVPRSGVAGLFDQHETVWYW